METNRLLLIISFLCPIIGFILYIIKRYIFPEEAREILKASLAGTATYIILGLFWNQ